MLFLIRNIVILSALMLLVRQHETWKAYGLWKFCRNSSQEFTFRNWHNVTWSILTWSNCGEVGLLTKVRVRLINCVWILARVRDLPCWWCANACTGSKLKEANDQQQFNRNVEDIEVWLGEIEGQLMSEDYGKASNLSVVQYFALHFSRTYCFLVICLSLFNIICSLLCCLQWSCLYIEHRFAVLQDLTSVQNLQKKHALLESDVASRQVCGVGCHQAFFGWLPSVLVDWTAVSFSYLFHSVVTVVDRQNSVGFGRYYEIKPRFRFRFRFWELSLNN